jgi:hypothetical protein
MVRTQDILFAILGAAVIALMAYDIQVVVLALFGAFACGALYVFVGMLPSPTESFWRRMFNSVFLAVVASSLVLILPGTLGLQASGRSIQGTVLAIAGALPLAAICFEIARTPRVLQGILRCIGRCLGHR